MSEHKKTPKRHVALFWRDDSEPVVKLMPLEQNSLAFKGPDSAIVLKGHTLDSCIRISDESQAVEMDDEETNVIVLELDCQELHLLNCSESGGALSMCDASHWWVSPSLDTLKRLAENFFVEEHSQDCPECTCRRDFDESMKKGGWAYFSSRSSDVEECAVGISSYKFQ